MITSILRNLEGTPNIVYIQTTNTLSEITASGYLLAQKAAIEAFNKGEFVFASDDYCLINYGNGEAFFTVNLSTNAFVAAPPAGGVSSTLTNTHILVGNAINVATDVAMSGDATIANTGAVTIANSAITTVKLAANAVTTAKLDPTTIQYATVTFSAAQFNGMYATPRQLVAAAGANTLVVLEQLQFLMTYNTTAFANGGSVAVQYDSTAHGAGVIASTVEANTVFQATASTGIVFNAGVVPETFTTCVNKGLFLSNISGAFDTGNSTFVAHVWYRIIPTV